jgi:TRAP-type C4-dicarboxylate transport system permease small subunit
MPENLDRDLKNGFLSRTTSSMNAVGCAWTGILMILTVIDVGGRYLFNRPLTGAPEIIQASIVGITFLQIPYVQFMDQHLRVTVFYDKLGDRAKVVLNEISYFLGALVFALICFSGWDFLIKAIRISEYDGTPASIMVPTWPVRSLIVFCSAIMVVVQVKQLIKEFLPKS